MTDSREAAVRSALQGDSAPLGSLVARALGGGGSVDASVNNALYFATSCEDDPFPWQRTASQEQRYNDLALSTRRR